jgi:electron transport complex protein RnfD
MLDILIALAPATVAAIVLFGLKAAVIIAVCVGSALLSEFVFNILAKKEQTVGDLTAVVTGLLLALNLSTNATIWQCLVGSVFAIVIVKCAFGGLGKNFVNPAIAAKVMLLIAFAGISPIVGEAPSTLDLLICNRAGSLGDACALALLVGGIYLVIRKVISWHTPVIYLGASFLLSLAFGADVAGALALTLGGTLVIGAIFMATDPVTSPKKWYGKVIFAVCCALITVLISLYGTAAEAVPYAILIMNILCPYIDMIGEKKDEEVAQ